MGNNQSQVPDDEDIPGYNYHESVLRDAQTGFINNDEQYFSAEESGTVSSSLTPERTRPKSSSGENSLDNSEGNYDSTEEDSKIKEPCEGHSLTHEVDLHVPVVAATNTNSTQADVRMQQSLRQRSASIFHENDSIDPEKEKTRESSSNRFTDSVDNTRSNIDACFTNIEVTTSQLSGLQTVNISSLNQTVPVQPSSSILNEEPIYNLGKRKISPDSERESVLPRKRMLTRSSSKQKRLGYSDSSESESEKEGSWKSNKKRKIILHSSKKVDCDSRERDSDENRFGKRRRIKKSRYGYDNESTESDDDTEDKIYCRRKHNNRRSKTSKNIKRRRKCNSEEGNDSSDEILKYRKRHRSKRHQVEETDSEQGEDIIKTRKILRDVSSQTADKNINEDICSSLLENTQNMAKSNTLSDSVTGAFVDADISMQLCHTLKMGNQSLRNSRGKVFPTRPQGQNDSASYMQFDTWRSSASDLRDIETLKLRLSEFGNLDSLASKRNNVWYAGKEPFNNSPVPISQPSPTEFKRIKSQIISEDHPSMQEDIHLSPFKNVILTTPNTNNMLNVMPQQPPVLNMAVNSNAEEHCSDMEVDESRVIMETQTNNKQIFISPNKRGVHHYRHKQNTVAARFRHFWSEKKKNIGQNLKLLFSKTNSSEKEHNFHSPTWQIFSSSYSQNNCSCGTPTESSVTFFNRDGLSGPSLSPSSPLLIPLNQQGSERSESTSQAVQTIEDKSANTTSQFNVLESETTQVLPQMFCDVGNKVQQSTSAVHSFVEWLPHAGQHQVLKFRLAGAVEMSVSFGDLADQQTSAIVNWTDGALTHRVTSCSKHIATKAGALMRAACNNYIESKGSNLEAPDVLITPAGGRFERAVQAVLHVVEPNLVNEDEECTSHALMEVFTNCLRFASERFGLDSISFPLIGDGKFPFLMCVKSFIGAVLVFLAEQSKSCKLSYIQLVIPDITAANFAAELIKSYLECVCCNDLESKTINQHLGHGQREVHQNVTTKTNPDISQCSQEKNITVDRAASGRPRLKRPRL